MFFRAGSVHHNNIIVHKNKLNFGTTTEDKTIDGHFFSLQSYASWPFRGTKFLLAVFMTTRGI